MTTCTPEMTAQDPFFLDQLGEVLQRTPRILLAEDDRETRCLLSSMLEDDGYEVVEAENGLELLHRLEPAFIHPPGAEPRREFDLVITDIHVPWLSAFAILAPFRKHDAETPVILIAAPGDELDGAEAESLGVAAVIEKPVDPMQLLNEVRRIIPSDVMEAAPAAG